MVKPHELFFLRKIPVNGIFYRFEAVFYTISANNSRLLST